jgi:hypothetical protein
MLRTAALSALFFVLWIVLTERMVDPASWAAAAGVAVVCAAYAIGVRGAGRAEARNPCRASFSAGVYTHIATLRAALVGRYAPALVRVRRPTAHGVLVDESGADSLIHVLDEEGAKA